MARDHGDLEQITTAAPNGSMSSTSATATSATPRRMSLSPRRNDVRSSVRDIAFRAQLEDPYLPRRCTKKVGAKSPRPVAKKSAARLRTLRSSKSGGSTVRRRRKSCSSEVWDLRPCWQAASCGCNVLSGGGGHRSAGGLPDSQRGGRFASGSLPISGRVLPAHSIEANPSGSLPHLNCTHALTPF